MTRNRRIATAATALAAAWCACAAWAAGDDRVMLLRSDADAYVALDREGAVRTEPDADLRLVIVRGGVVAADHGLARIDSPGTLRDGDGRLVRRARTLEDRAWIAGDARTAVVLRSNVTLDRPLDVRGDRSDDGVRVERARVALTWFDPEHPEGRWTHTFPSGRWLASVRLIDPGSGVAVLVDDGDRAAFQVFDPDGRIVAHRDDLLAVRPTVLATTNGAALVADLALTAREGSPDRLLFVVDLEAGAAWSYPWTYGSDREPVNWEFEDDRTLRVDTTLATYRYGIDGTSRGMRRRR